MECDQSQSRFFGGFLERFSGVFDHAIVSERNIAPRFATVDPGRSASFPQVTVKRFGQ